MANSKPILNGLNLAATDMQATLDFYRLLGFPIPEDAGAASGGHHVEVQMGDGLQVDFDSPELVGVYNEGASSLKPGATATIGFSVASRDEVDARFQTLTEAGHRGLQPPFDAFWGARYAIVEDPDGRPVGIMSPVDPERQSAPPGLS